MGVEILFESKGRFRVIRYLLEEGQANISKIVKNTGLPHRLVVKHLRELERHGIVEEKRYGRLRLFEVNLEDPRISATKNLIRELERIWGDD